MAVTARGAQLTILHRQRQLQLRAALITEMRKSFPGWALNDATSYDMLEGAMLYLVREGSQKSAALAASYYKLFRLIEAPSAPPLPAIELAAAPPLEQIRTALRVTAKGSAYRSLGAGMQYTEAMDNAFVSVSGSMSRLALNSGRDTIMQAVRGDRGALGWARVTGGEPCAFCAMLSSRGPVYKAETADFRSHDHCSCSAEPVYEGSEWPGRAREFNQIWDQTKSLSAFREALATR